MDNKTKEKEQITIPIEPSKKELYYNVKRKVNRFGIFFGAIPYWKHIINVVAFISSILVIVVDTLLLIQLYGQLPNKIPLFYFQATKSWSLTDKELLIVIPIFSGIILILLSRLNSSVFRFDRRLAIMINVSIFIFNIFFIIAILQLFSLVLVY